MSTLTLTLPYNYVEIEQEEMMYLDGGLTNTEKAGIIAAAVLGGAALTAAIVLGQLALGAKILGFTVKQYAKKLGAKVVADLIVKTLPVSYGATVAVIGFLLTI